MGGQGGDRGEPRLAPQRGALCALRRAPKRPYRRREPLEDPRGAVPRGRDADRTSERDQIMTLENKHRADNLARSLDAVVEDCVNSVGVDVNTASVALLARVSKPA